MIFLICSMANTLLIHFLWARSQGIIVRPGKQLGFGTCLLGYGCKGLLSVSIGML